MNDSPGAPTVLVADEDVGFIWWVAELLAEFGYRSIPALGVRQALSLVRKSGNRLDLALINPRLRGTARLMFILRRSHAPKLVFIHEPGPRSIRDIGVLATIEKPHGYAPISRMEWRQKLHRLLLQIGSRAAS